MAQTITPVVHGGRRRSWGGALLLHVLGATLAAGAFGAILGAGGALLGAPWGRATGVVVAVVALAYAAREVAGLPVPVPELRRQVPEWWRSAFAPGPAAFLYGLGLGIGFLTYLRHGTLVAVAAAAVALGDPWLGVAAMAPFGLARSVAVAASWRATTEDGLRRTTAALERLGEGPLRRAVNAAVLVGMAAVAAVTTAGSGDGFPSSLWTTLLAGTFLWAALAKAAAADAWERALQGYDLPPRVRAAARPGVPVLEAAAAGLLLGGATRAGAALALLLLTAFSAAIVRRGSVALPCGCFGGARARPARWLLTRNAALMAVTIAVAVVGSPVPLPPAPGPEEVLPAALTVGGAILAAMLFGRASALWPRRGQTTG